MRELRLVAIDASPPPRLGREARGPVPSGASQRGEAIPQPPVISRAEWGADESLRRGQPSFAPIRRMAVHHTVTETDDPDPAATIRAIYAYHTLVNGWDDIGYNFLVDADGRIYEGRYARPYGPGEDPTGEDAEGRGVVGAHTAGNNPGTVGVALLGTFTSRRPTHAALDALERLCTWEADRHAIDPLGTTAWSAGEGPTIIGHRDVRATACPGDRFYAALPDLRQGVADLLAAARSTTDATGYWILAEDGRVYPFGQAEAPLGDQPVAIAAPACSVASTPSGDGYWVLLGDGRLMPFGDAQFFGSTVATRPGGAVIRLEPTPAGRGYWILGVDGEVSAFGDAGLHGSVVDVPLPVPVVGLASTPSGQGYWIVAADGGVFSFGDADFLGSGLDLPNRLEVVSMGVHPSGRGYWLLGADGGVFSFGDARFFGSIPGLQLGGVAPSVQIRPSLSGAGYCILTADGGVFSFGDARFFGNASGLPTGTTAVDLTLRLGPRSP